MGQYRLQEYWCIISNVRITIVMHYCLKVLEAWALCMIIMYVTESDKIMSSSIDSKLLSYCTRVFLLQNCHLKTFIHYRQPFIDWYTMIHRYIDISMYWYLIFTVLIHTLQHYASLCINASQYRPISTTPMSDHSKLYINEHENGYNGSTPLRYGTVHYQAPIGMNTSIVPSNPSKILRRVSKYASIITVKHA